MLAMLGISAILLIRDMAKIISSGKTKKETTVVYDCHPQKEKIANCARSFQKLADTFYRLPDKQEKLSPYEVESITRSAKGPLCSLCQQRQIHKQLVWDNRLIENRYAVAEQLEEVAHIVSGMARELYDIAILPVKEMDELERCLRKRHILLKKAWQVLDEKEHQQIFLTLRTRGGQCIPVSDAAEVLSQVMACPMAPVQNSRNILNSTFTTVRFMEAVRYKTLYGVAKVTKDQETVSGDNYACLTQIDGKFVLCLSDGMGSGLPACQESEKVIELLEQFLESGFTKETATRMINSALVLQRQEEMFSTVDICVMNLYTGMCEFLKAGAASTFIKRDNRVEIVSSASLAVGLAQRTDFETTGKKLNSGDYLVMVTDGVLDALPVTQEEDVMRDIILNMKNVSPREMGKRILEKVLGYARDEARDDMTVLVAGIWEK
ncbi:MAG: SpoIIE family protein phosphatase [Lachnospiraceae bacterium]|nr:SpoIIE family protein phosphatase [Lachnospiraceae bacterium]